MSHPPTESRPLAIVTGGARGIGLATAQTLVANGYEVISVDGPAMSTMPYPLTTPAQHLQTATSHLHPESCDVRDQLAITELVDRSMARYGPVHVAIAGAGVLAGSPSSLDLDPHQGREILDVDFWGVVHLATATVPTLRSTRGHFIAISSAAGTRGLPRLAHYCAAKHAVHGFLAALAREELPHGLHINVVAPGSTRTALLDATAAIYGLNDIEDFLAQQLDSALNVPSDIAATIAFLISPAGAAINGAVVPVDRGFIG